MTRLFAALKRLTPFAAFSLLLAAGCNQDPIFDYIAGEAAPTTALIKGSPSKIVSVKTTGSGEKLYIANGRIWELKEPNSRWSRIAGPEGLVTSLASTSDGVLYALVIDNTATGVWQYNGTGWTELIPPTDYGFIQNIFGAGDALFATGAKSAGGSYNYAILYKESNQFTVVKEKSTAKEIDDALLTGAGKIGSDYYLSARGKGIYKVSVAGGALTAELISATPSVPLDIAGLLQANESLIIGISKGGVLLRIADDPGTSRVTVDATSLGGIYTGALALMKSPEPQNGYNQLLLLGHRNSSSSSYQHGYVELQYGADGRHGAARIPGDAQPSSVSDYRQYDSSLRRYPVTTLWVLNPQSPSSVIFAGTTNQGLYSYRERSDGGRQWNHEE